MANIQPFQALRYNKDKIKIACLFPLTLSLVVVLILLLATAGVPSSPGDPNILILLCGLHGLGLVVFLNHE